MLCFLHLPKTGGSTLNGVLRQNFGPRHVDLISSDGPWMPITARDVRLAHRLHPGLRSVASHRIGVHDGLGDDTWRWFTVVREPVARTISEYQFYRTRLGGDLDLEGYVEVKGLRNLQVRRIAGAEALDVAFRTLRERFFFVGHMERFDESLAALSVLIDEPGFSAAYLRKNTASDHRIADQMKRDPGIMRYLADITVLDAELYAGVRDRIFPEYLKRAEAQGMLPDISTLSAWRFGPRLMANRFVRNVWYKPAARAAQTIWTRS